MQMVYKNIQLVNPMGRQFVAVDVIYGVDGTPGYYIHNNHAGADGYQGITFYDGYDTLVDAIKSDNDVAIVIGFNDVVVWDPDAPVAIDGQLWDFTDDGDFIPL